MSAAHAALLLNSAEAVEAVQLMCQELHWLHAVRAEVPSLASQRWDADDAARLLVQACLGALTAPGSAPQQKAQWVQRLHMILATAGLTECRAALASRASVAVLALRRVALELLQDGARDLTTLMCANRCLAQVAKSSQVRSSRVKSG